MGQLADLVARDAPNRPLESNPTVSGGRARPVLFGLLVVVAGSLAGCLADPVTDRGRRVADLYTWFTVAAAGVFVVVSALLAWSLVRYRGQAGRDVAGSEGGHGNLALEAAWWAAPTILVAVLVWMTVDVLGEVDAVEPAPEVNVEVHAFQWGWRFSYPDAGVVVDGTAADPPVIHLPVDRSIAFHVTSSDVVHSFSIPSFLIKRDAIPSRPNRFDLLIEEQGTYAGQCGEFCGLLHAEQRFVIQAVGSDAFDAWLAAEQLEADE